MTNPVRTVASADCVTGRPVRASAGDAFRNVLACTIDSLVRDGSRLAPTEVPVLEPAAALELQAGLYAQLERVELTSRVLDHAVGAVKTILQTRL